MELFFLALLVSQSLVDGLITGRGLVTMYVLGGNATVIAVGILAKRKEREKENERG